MITQTIRKEPWGGYTVETYIDGRFAREAWVNGNRGEALRLVKDELERVHGREPWDKVAP